MKLTGNCINRYPQPVGKAPTEPDVQEIVKVVQTPTVVGVLVTDTDVRGPLSTYGVANTSVEIASIGSPALVVTLIIAEFVGIRVLLGFLNPFTIKLIAVPAGQLAPPLLSEHHSVTAKVVQVAALGALRVVVDAIVVDPPFSVKVSALLKTIWSVGIDTCILAPTGMGFVGVNVIVKEFT